MRESIDGKKNIYTCSICRGHIVTRDREEGVTPFMISCKATENCKGMMQSSMYRVFDGSMAATYEWYKPLDMRGLSAGEREHVSMGGLLLRKM